MDESLIFDRYFNLSLRFLSYRPRSEQEVYKYLFEKSKKAKNLNEQIIAKIMHRLIELKFIDDLEFARFWITNRKKGLKIVKFELSQKGIAKEIIEKALSEFDILGKEESLILKLIEKKKRSLVNVEKGKAQKKMIAFLLRKGFEYGQIKKFLHKNIEF